MRILFDKNVPDPLRRSLPAHDVATSAERGWGQLRNGELLQAAEVAGFDLLVTADQNIRYQQNLTARRIALVVLGSNRWPYLQRHVAAVAAAVERARPNSYDFVEVPLPPKPAYKPEGWAPGPAETPPAQSPEVPSPDRTSGREH